MNYWVGGSATASRCAGSFEVAVYSVKKLAETGKINISSFNALHQEYQETGLDLGPNSSFCRRMDGYVSGAEELN